MRNVVHKDIPSLPKTIWSRIKIVKECLTLSPEKVGDPLLGEFKGHRRIRSGDYRLVYRISKLERMVIITYPFRGVIKETIDRRL
ncbi:MAG: type II toxin-antitoxin system RelE family toxin [Wolbachia sp.]